MKRKIFIAFLVIMAFTGCKKDEELKESDDNHYTNLHGTVLEIDPSTEPPILYAENSINLDIDKDNIDDVTFTVTTEMTTFGPRYSYNGVHIEPLNGFKVDTIQYSKIRTSSNHGDQVCIIVIPRIYNNGDSILNTNTFSDGKIQVTSNTYTGSDDSRLSNDTWLNIGTKYIVLKKEGSPNNEYCWIKVNVMSYKSIKLLSCYFTKDVSSMKIIDPY
jgi:hypothetical protein